MMRLARKGRETNHDRFHFNRLEILQGLGAVIPNGKIPEIRQREALCSHACLRFSDGSGTKMARVIGAMEKKLRKIGKLKRLWEKITAADE